MPNDPPELELSLEGELSAAAIDYLAALAIELYRVETIAPAESPRGEVLTTEGQSQGNQQWKR